MPYPPCSHRKDDGVLCGSPALRGAEYCYVHIRERFAAYYGASARRRPSGCRFDLPLLDDRRAILSMLSQVAQALARRRSLPSRRRDDLCRTDGPCRGRPILEAINKAMQLLANEEFACKLLTARILRKNSPYPQDKTEFQPWKKQLAGALKSFGAKPESRNWPCNFLRMASLRTSYCRHGFCAIPLPS